MIKIAITPYNIIPNESQYISTILDYKWDYVHLRHPKASLSELKQIIEKIPKRLHNKIKLHSHFELCNEYDIGGLHLNHNCPIAPYDYMGKLSKSCHSIDEVNEQSFIYEYVTLSPIFDSISKNGYKSTFDNEQLLSIKETNVIALGGITPYNINQLECYKFAGFAVLGYLFDNQINELILQKRLKEFNY